MADADYNDALRRPQAAAAAAAAAPVNKDELTASIQKITREVNESITSKYNKLVLPNSVREIFEKFVKGNNNTEKALKLTKQYILDMFFKRQPQNPLPEDEHPDTAALLASPQNPPPPPPQAAAAVNPDAVDSVVKILTQTFGQPKGGKKSRMSKSRKGKKSKIIKSRRGKRSKMTKSRRGKKSKMTRKKV